VFDSDLRHDQGWLEDPTPDDWASAREDQMRSARAGFPDYPPTYQPLSPSAGLNQRAAFDPLLSSTPTSTGQANPSSSPLIPAPGGRPPGEPP
jgi:hypothetical protein